METMKQSLSLIHVLNMVDLMKALIRNRIGLALVEKQVSHLCKELPKKKTTMVMTMMKWKLKDAFSKVHDERKKNMVYGEKRNLSLVKKMSYTDTLLCVEMKRRGPRKNLKR